jgi:hypothetical protein
MRPDQFVGVEFWRVAGKPFEMQTGAPRLQGLHVWPLVNAAAVQHEDHLAAEMPQQCAEKDGDLDVGDVLPRMQMQIEADAAALGTDGDGRDRGDLVALIAMADDRGLAPGGPRPPDVGDQEEPAFVGERQVGLQAPRVFFILVQRYRFQRSMAASSRSIARRSGFWHDHARAVSTRPTCARCRRTPNSRWITVAIRWVVHSSVSNPQAAAPRSKRRGSVARWRAVNFGGRPGAGLAVKAVGPRRATASRHKMTELWEQPSRRATSVIEAPAFKRSTARRRRRSSSSGLPWGLIPEQYTHATMMSITYAQVNKRGFVLDFEIAPGQCRCG